MKILSALIVALLPMAAASGKPAPQQGTIIPGPYIIFFDYRQAVVTPEAMAILENAMSNCASGSTANARITINVGGGADTSETAEYAFARAKETVRILRQMTFSYNCYANFDLSPVPLPLRVATAPGVRELQNRRAEIIFGPSR